MLKYFVLFSLTLATISCGSGRNAETGTVTGDADSLTDYGEVEVSHYVVESIISDLSSIIEEAAFLRDIGVPFSDQYLASTTNVHQTSGNENLIAFNLGVMGSNLGYLCMYQRFDEVPEYVEKISMLTGKMNMGELIDFEVLLRFARTQGDMDSLVYLSVHGYNRLNDYLIQNNREHLSAAMVTGLFLEGLYLLTQAVESYQSNDLAERIGEQKFVINDLLLAMRYYQNEFEPLKEMADELEKIKNEFHDVNITYEMGDPETVEKDGKLMIIQNEKSNVEISGETLARISANTKSLRNEFLF